jgi:predicted dehydrogenase
MLELGRNLKWGMIGGGPGAFIGEVHRKAARMDGGIELVAGAFDINPEKSKQMGKTLNICPSRAYNTYQEMIEGELKLPVGERVDLVSITTPNNFHFPIAKAFLESGFNVVCEKPMTFNVEEAEQLVEVVKKTGMVFGLQHNYTGYPMVKLARQMVKDGDLGPIRKVVVQYAQGWLSTVVQNMQASWRTDPEAERSGWVHGRHRHACGEPGRVHHGLRIEEMCADLTAFVPGRLLDDDGNVLLRFNNGAKGILHASQISVGEENNLAIWIYGEKAGVEWHQEHPNYLYVKSQDQPTQVWKRGNGYVGARCAAAGRATRTPSGHPEAFLEAFGNLYCNVTDTIRAKLMGIEPDPVMLDFPTVEDGLRGMQFIETVVKSSKATERWTKMPK